MDIKKICLFLVFAFGISWLTAAIMYFTGIEYGSYLSMALVAVFYMAAPAFATLIVQKWIYKENVKPYGWVLKGIKIKWLIVTILLSMCFVLGTLGVIGLFGNGLGVESFGYLDFSEEGFNANIIEIVNEALKDSDFSIPDIETKMRENPIPVSPVWILVIVFGVGIIAAFTVNLPFMFGEEFGWRGLLLKETQELGFLKSNLLIGVIWGLWHAPIILMGHNFPDYPIIGVGMMVLLTTALAFPFAYSRLKTKSILAPCVMHGMINGTAGSFAYFAHGGNDLIGGMAGVAGVIVISTVGVCIFLFDRKFVREYKSL